MTAPAVLQAPAIPAPRTPSEPRPRRVRPPEQYWSVYEARWVTARR